jgi:hypothetical protein
MNGTTGRLFVLSHGGVPSAFALAANATSAIYTREHTCFHSTLKFFSILTHSKLFVDFSIACVCSHLLAIAFNRFKPIKNLNSNYFFLLQLIESTESTTILILASLEMVDELKFFTFDFLVAFARLWLQLPSITSNNSKN